MFLDPKHISLVAVQLGELYLSCICYFMTSVKLEWQCIIHFAEYLEV